MDISISDLAAICSADCLISNELAHKVDTLTHSFGSAYDTGKVSLCNEAWAHISNSLRFWENTSLLLTLAEHDETKLQVLILILKRIRNSWYFQDPEIRKNIKIYMTKQSQLYNAANMSKTRKSYFRKINQIIVQILKYQWMSEWTDFLPSICSAIYENESLAENHFDLLSVIFSQIFSQQEKLTSQERKNIRQQILAHYTSIQQIFQKYLVKQYGNGTLRNCLQALNNLVLWVPPYYIFYGQITQKLIDILQNTPNKLQVLSCLQSIITLPYDDMVEGFLGKVYQKKISIISYILGNKSLQGNKEIGIKILNITIKFLQQQKNDIQKYGEKTILLDSKTSKQNKAILQKLLQWMSCCEEDNQIIDIYKYITAITNKQSMVNIVQALVKVTPCPIDTTFYGEENILKIQNIESPEYAEDRKNYIQSIRNIVQAQQQGYFSLIIQQLNQNFNNLNSLKTLCKLTWNFYYFIEVAPTTKIKQKIFAVVNQLILIQDKAQANVSANKMLNISIKTMYITKLGFVLILGHKKSIQSGIFNQIYFQSILNNISEANNRFVKAIISFLQLDALQYHQKMELNKRYIHAMHPRNGRLEVDLKFIEIIGKWANQKPENFNVGVQLMKELIKIYQSMLVNCYNQNINSNEDISIAKNNIFQVSLKQLQILSKAIYYFKSQIIFEVMSQINIIKQTIALYDLTGNEKQNIRYFQLASNVFSMLFSELKQQQINKNIEVLFNLAGEISCFILQAIKNRKINEEVAGSMLLYLSKYVQKLAEWPIQEENKVAIIYKILVTVYASNYTHDQLGFTKFISSIIKCKKLAYMQGELIKKTFLQIFILATLQDQNKTIQAIEIFKQILNDSMDSNTSQQFVYNHILNIVSHIYLLIINLKSSIEFAKQYSEVLFMALIFIRNLKMKFTSQQIQDNLTQLKNMLTKVTNQVYTQYNQHFMQKVSNFLGMILTITNRQQFSQKIKDLIIVLRRGY